MINKSIKMYLSFDGINLVNGFIWNGIFIQNQN